MTANSRRLKLGQEIEIPIADSKSQFTHACQIVKKLRITRGKRWVPTLIKGLGRRRYLRTTNLSNQPLTLFDDKWVGIWLSGDRIPRHPDFVPVGSRLYNE
ncbi:LOW QUALITY PROTEIN: Hypothetical protein PHPALM_18212 [Phytophthora palmivora]|uniref:Uncharacterized protein n=1 Tax=Phytophthora palmivora TaxID=4796 RepID=A0A2P4XKA5_9STRA|nr:LOW QUALITY PROTEIN: Hypothetical protein PHPALM_18212 [Phytophthora palmivora]